jgi:membrane-bound metal-dependent hydrolase YbcI (DUF457 family)
VEPVTHALTSLALARAMQKRLPRFSTAILIVSGVASDLDYLSYFAGPGAFLRFHRAVLHSLVGSAFLVFTIAAVFCRMNRGFTAKSNLPRLSFLAAITLASLGAVGHLALDLTSGEAVQFLWPLRVSPAAWNLARNFDLWILILLVAGLLLPGFLRLVSEEIGERKETEGPRRGVAITLLLMIAYLGARGILHHNAFDRLYSREYRGRAPVLAGAFPDSGSPFKWRGVVVTDTTIEEVTVSVAPGAEFDPDRSQTHFKPQRSAALDAGEQTRTAALFLKYARFPLASVFPFENGDRFELRDLQFAADDTSPVNIFVRVDFDHNLRIEREQFLYASMKNR